MEISANLVGNVQFLRELEQQFHGYKTSDFAFMILHEWKTSIKNTRQTPSAGKLLDELHDLQIDKHILCQVCYYASYDTEVLVFRQISLNIFKMSLAYLKLNRCDLSNLQII